MSSPDHRQILAQAQAHLLRQLHRAVQSGSVEAQPSNGHRLAGLALRRKRRYSLEKNWPDLSGVHGENWRPTVEAFFEYRPYLLREETGKRDGARMILWMESDDCPPAVRQRWQSHPRRPWWYVRAELQIAPRSWVFRCRWDDFGPYMLIVWRQRIWFWRLRKGA